MLRTRCYRDGKLQREGFDVSEVSDLIADPANLVWFDLCGPDAQHLEVIQEELGLHDLALEKLLQQGQRPKLDVYPGHMFVAAYSVRIEPDSGKLISHEVGALITPRALVTVRPDEGFDIDEVVRRWDAAPQLGGGGVGYLLHGLLDYAVDTHLAAVELLDDAIDGLEDRLFDDITTDAQMQRRTYELRKTLVNMRRLVLPMRDILGSLLHRDLNVVNEVMAPYFQDVYDHVLRVGEWTDSLRDLVANLLETRLTVRSNRLNVIMKKVTSWAAIIAVPTAVTGFYGQNLPYPGFGEHWGVWVSTGFILAASLVLYVTFKRKDWL